MPVALGVNGGVLGSNNLPSSGSAKGIWTTNEIARAVALGFWPVNYARSITETATGADVISTGANADPYFNYTTLLLSTTATNGQQNNTFQDSSTNNFTITRNPATGPNAPTQGTFSPFSQTGWGNYFNGSSYLSAGTTLFNYTTGNASTTTFTIEAFIYLNSYQSTATVYYNPCIISKGDVYLNLGVNGSGNLIFYHYDGTVRSITGSSVIPLATWTYVAVTVTGGTATLYVNSTSVGSGTWYGIQAAGQNTTSLIGRASTNASSLYFNGYISNLRVSTVARTIATPTTAYTNDANTALLTAQSNRFIDNSSSPITLTVTGTPSVVPFSPFNPTSAWSASTVGGSGYFDGTGDYLDLPSSANLATSSSDFTIECWAYFNATANAYIFSGSGATIQLFSGSVISYDGSNHTLGAVSVGQWFHLVVCRSGSTIKAFLNGVQGSSWTNSGTQYTHSSGRLGAEYGTGNLGLNGYISNYRFIVGTALYTANFTPPTAPLTAITNTSLLLNFTNSGIYDATAKNVLETVGNAQVSTTQSKWSPTSMYFDGTGDYLLIPDNPSQRIGIGNFTIECWVYRNASGTYGLIGKGTGTTGWLLSLNSSNQVVFTYGSSTITSTGTISATTWTHIAVVRSGTGANLTKIYIGGTNDGTGTVSTDFNQTNAMYVAADRTGGSNANAYVQDTRVTLYARYSANFTPPTATFPVQ